VREWHEEGSVTCKKPPGQLSSVHKPENIARMLVSVGRSPRWSASKHAQVWGKSERSVQHILHSDLHLHPYKLQIVQSLNDQDKEVRLQFSRHFQGILTENPNLLNNLLMSDEADFHLHGIVNKQNFRYWSNANPHKLHQHPLYDPKFTAWCGVWSSQSLDPTSLRMKMGKPSQSHHNVTQRWSMNF